MVNNNEQSGKRERNRYRVDALARGLTALAAFSRTSQRLSPRELSRMVGIPITTARRVLTSLQADGYVARDSEGLFGLTLRALDLGYGGSFGLQLGQLAKVDAWQLHKTLDAAVYVSIFAGAETISILSFVRPGFVHPLAHRFPIYATSSGKAYLAFCPPGELSSVMEAIAWERLAPNTITRREEFMRELQLIRSRGYSINNEELSAGMVSIGMPIFNADEQPIAAISAQAAIGMTELAEVERLFIPHLSETARRITERVSLMDLDQQGAAARR
ncbi:MAG: IclR family transcriptional regulator [Hyphomonadaceae bacterium]|nr:IclR family transcriptional regulator [Hyphomonadaceae bacterium]